MNNASETHVSHECKARECLYHTINDIYSLGNFHCTTLMDRNLHANMSTYSISPKFLKVSRWSFGTYIDEQ